MRIPQINIQLHFIVNYHAIVVYWPHGPMIQLFRSFHLRKTFVHLCLFTDAWTLHILPKNIIFNSFESTECKATELFINAGHQQRTQNTYTDNKFRYEKQKMFTILLFWVVFR